MKNWAKIAGGLIAMVLLFGSVQAWAASKTQDREFNHMSTGFPLAGVHATTACEACHVGGVFVGTPRACDGCHATGKRIVATPKSTKHIVTDAPCETCHFNTSTFFGARYNHGTAMPGQCENCHNGRITQGKPTSHPVTIYPCDNCHRSSSWLPASWNHRDTVSDCSVCHKVGGPGRNYTSTRHSGAYTTLTILTPCRECHTNYYSFFSYYYTHSGPGAVSTCGDCHNNAAYANGVMQIASTAAHTNYATVGITQCTSCHRSKAPGTFPTGKYDHSSPSTCDVCHSGHGVGFTGVTQKTSTRHTTYAAAATGSGVLSLSLCSSCHTSTVTWAGATYNHSGVTDCAACHKNAAYSPDIRQMSAKHIPFDATVTNCMVCHTNASSWATVARGATLHGYVTTLPGCFTCHGSNTAYPGNGQQTARWPSFHESSKNPAATDCSASGCHRPLGTKGTAYVRWH
jgi:hypothetical protein